MKITKELVEQAYKKLKSSVYFDKTQLALRNRIVELELEYPAEKLDSFLKTQIYDALRNDNAFDKLLELICQDISVIALPKKMKKNGGDFITNSVSGDVSVEELQFYIDMPVEGHILGVLWIMLIGYLVDDSIYVHSYGNRIRKKLINELSDQPTYSPYLFEPYFEQYESWRDKALTEAQEHMKEKQDVIILTIDFKRYYYSLDVTNQVMEKLYSGIGELLEASFSKDNVREQSIKKAMNICARLNRFVGSVIDVYSGKFDNQFDERRILPIGFLPSNIIGNWCLRNFDKAVVDGWNPVYYGRYVDDIIIVDKIERNSSLQEKLKSNKLKTSEIIEYFLTSCSRWKGTKPKPCSNTDNYAVFQINPRLTEEANNEAESRGEKRDKTVYSVNKLYNPLDKDNGSEIVVQNDKVKIFHFKGEETDALITCFKRNIAKNKSEFRHMPEDESVFQADDYSDIYSLSNSDTVNKFRGIEDISIDRYKLSKFLGKYLRIGSMIRDKSESRFEKDIVKIFNARAIIEHYSMWEKIIEILVINERFTALTDFCKRIVRAIEEIKLDSKISDRYSKEVQKALYIQLHAGLCRSFALVWKEKKNEAQKEIYSDILKSKVNCQIDRLVRGYYQTRMIDKSVIPILSEMIDDKRLFNSLNTNLTRFDETITLIKKNWEKDCKAYKYFPYLLNMFDLEIASCIEQMCSDEPNPFDNISCLLNNEKARYIEVNYRVDKVEKHSSYNLINVDPILQEMRDDTFLVSVGEDKKNKLKISIANVRLNATNFEKIIKGVPNRTYSRYKDLVGIVNSAINEHADMLIMPEAYVPFEWINILARTCAKNNMAIITGVEHVMIDKKDDGHSEASAYNLTAVILPYKEETHKSAHISFHLKKHYAPSEVEKLQGYRMMPVCGKNYELYKWNDCYFPVYCCYELTSIEDRSLFQSYADMIVAVEWNRDVIYYSNILESLSRDIHCYCIQVNSSDYGDSRITKPSKSEEKDTIRTKGGTNSSILVDEIDIAALREFQLKEYTLQKKDEHFKPTPPNFSKDIVLKKIKGERVV